MAMALTMIRVMIMVMAMAMVVIMAIVRLRARWSLWAMLIKISCVGADRSPSDKEELRRSSASGVRSARPSQSRRLLHSTTNAENLGLMHRTQPWHKGEYEPGLCPVHQPQVLSVGCGVEQAAALGWPVGPCP